MPFIAPIIGFVAGLGAIGTAVVSAALSVGLGYIAQKFLAPKPQAASASTSATGTQVNVQFGGAVPRDTIFGWQATAGQFIYWNLYGANNDSVQLVYAVGDGPHEALAGLYADGNIAALDYANEDPIKGVPLLNFRASSTVTAQQWLAAIGSDFGNIFNFFKTASAGTSPTPALDALRASIGAPLAWIKFYDGSEGQVADQGLINQSNPAGRWTVDHKMTGIAYVVITLQYDQNTFQSIPNFLFVIKGRKLYDLRKDDTNGGTGSHRWDDQSTWEWSDNPAIALYNYQRGLYLNGALVVGEGVAAIDLMNDMFVTAANICDEDVAVKGSVDTEKRYRLAFNAGADRSHEENIQSMLDAMAGVMVESVGAFGPIAGAASSVQMEFSDGDLIAGQPVKYSSHRSRANLINTVSGSYTEPDQQWSSIPFPLRTSSLDEAVDGERLAKQIDFPPVFSNSQAQRCAEIERRASRKQKSATVPLGFRFAPLQTGDWVRWNSARYGVDVFRVDGRSIDDNEIVHLVLTNTGGDVFSWDESTDQLDPTIPGDLPGANALATNVAGFAMVAQQIDGDNGLTIPAIQILWTPPTDPTITSVVVQYRIKSDDDSGIIKTIRFSNVQDGHNLIAEGIQAATLYEGRVTIDTTPPRLVTISPWIEEMSSPLQVVALAKRVDEVFWEDFETGIEDTIKQAPAALAEAFAQRKQNDLNAQSIINLAQDIITRSDKQTQYDQTHREEVGSAVGQVSAAVAFEMGARADADTAEANLRIALAVIVGMNTTSITAEADARSTADTSEANLRIALAATVGANTTAITNETTARQTADTSEANLRIALAGTVASNSSAITNETTARTTADSAQTTQYNNLSTTVNGHTSSISTLTTSINGVSVKFGVLGTINGVTGGFIFTGVQQLDGSVSYGLEVDGNVIVNGTLTSSKFAANSVTAGIIAAGAVNASNIIVNNIVVTGHIVNNAVSQIWETNGGSVGVGQNQLLAMNFTPSVGEVIVNAEMQVDFTAKTGNGASSLGRVDLYIDGTLVKSRTIMYAVVGADSSVPNGNFSLYYRLAGSVHIAAHAFVSAGVAHTVQLYFVSDVNGIMVGAAGSASAGELIVQELKR